MDFFYFLLVTMVYSPGHFLIKKNNFQIMWIFLDHENNNNNNNNKNNNNNNIQIDSSVW